VGEAPVRYRIHGRRKVNLRVVVWHPRAGWQREADVHDVSLGGACVSLNETLAEGDRVTISFVAPTLWDPLSMNARVVWVGPGTRIDAGRAGVRFEPKDAATVFALFELVGTLG
jgi:hypothetical protein